MKITQSQFNEITQRLYALNVKKINATDSSLIEEYDEMIAILETILSESNIVYPEFNGKGQIGSICNIVSENGCRDLEVELVENQILPSSIKRASINSPMGSELLGSKLGDIISVVEPGGQTVNYKVYGLTNGEIEYLTAPEKTRK